MFWYRMEVGLGRHSIVGSTVRRAALPELVKGEADDGYRDAALVRQAQDAAGAGQVRDEERRGAGRAGRRRRGDGEERQTGDGDARRDARRPEVTADGERRDAGDAGWIGLEDARELGGQDVVFLGAPYDGGTTYRPGTRFGPDALRRVGASPYNPGFGVDLGKSLTMADLGNIQVIPSNLEKSFDQIAKAMSFVTEREVFPVVLGGDHAIGYPNVRGISPYIDGNIGIIHFDRHVDTQETDLDQRMHTTPWFHATDLPNGPPKDLVQIGIGGWQGPPAGAKCGRGCRTTSMTRTARAESGI